MRFIYMCVGYLRLGAAPFTVNAAYLLTVIIYMRGVSQSLYTSLGCLQRSSVNAMCDISSNL